MEKYYGWLGASGYDSVVLIKDYSEAYVFNREKKKFIRNDDYIKAAFDPGSEFDVISKEEAAALLKEWGYDL